MATVWVLFIGTLTGCTMFGDRRSPRPVTVPEISFLLPNDWPQPGERLILRGLYEGRNLRVVHMAEAHAQVTWYTLDRPPESPLTYGEARVTANGYASLTLDAWRSLPMDLDAVTQACAQAIEASAAALSAVQWADLALPNYRDSTATFRFAPEFASQPDGMILGIDEEAGEALCAWQGPMLPEQMPLVERWVMLYPVYDLNSTRVERLIVTIEGRVLE